MIRFDEVRIVVKFFRNDRDRAPTQVLIMATLIAETSVINEISHHKIVFHFLFGLLVIIIILIIT